MIDLNEYKKYGSIAVVIMSFILIAVSGVFLGLLYFTLDQTNTAFLSTDCVINNNTLVSSCQDLWSMALYPFLAMKEILIWASYFIIFGLVLGLLIWGYQSGRSPIMLGLLVLFVIILTYMGIEVSNMYRTLLENEIFRNIMVDFTIYNRVMLNFPWFVFIVSFSSFMLGLVNYQRTKVNSPTEELDY